MRRIDHVVVAVHNLDQAGDFYRRLGFQVGQRNQHSWGTENRLLQFRSSFIELITVGSHADAITAYGKRRFSFGAFIRDYLQGREGLAMLVLSSDNAEEDAAQFAGSGIGDFETFSFEREGVRPDGSKTHVAFSLAFACDSDTPGAGFFVCQQHLPENFWDCRYQKHANHARDITAVALTTATPGRHVQFLSAFTGVKGRSHSSGKYTFGLDGGRVELRQDLQAREPSLTSFTIQVDDVEAMARTLDAEKMPFVRSDDALVISEAFALGTEIRFESGQHAWSDCARYDCPYDET